MEMRFWKVEPLRVSSSVFLSDSAVLTGAEGSIQPFPLPADPGVENTLREVVERVEAMDGEKAVASWAVRRMLERVRAAIFILASRLICGEFRPANADYFVLSEI